MDKLVLKNGIVFMSDDETNAMKIVRQDGTEIVDLDRVEVGLLINFLTQAHGLMR